MDINQFLRDRRPRWSRLSDILDQVDSKGVENLSADQADEFFMLYRLASSDLNLIQTRTGNPTILEYLEGLVGRAYANLAVPKQVNPFKAWWNIVRHRFPATIRAEKGLLAITTAVFLSGAVFGFFVTLAKPSSANIILPPSHLVQNPSERVAELEDMERQGDSRVNSAGKHAIFTTFLFTHNIRVTVFAFALGLTFGIGTVIMIFYNSVLLGSLAALYYQEGVMVFFAAWIGPHGVVEIPCILFGATAGLMFARAQFRSDKGSFGQQMRDIRPAMVNIIIGTGSLLVLAGAIEGGFSQVNEPTIPYPLKIAVAAAFFIALLFYLFWMPVKNANSVSGISPSKEADAS